MLFFYNIFLFECYMFGNYAHELIVLFTFGEVYNTVITMQFDKVKVFQGILFYSIKYDFCPYTFT